MDTVDDQRPRRRHTDYETASGQNVGKHRSQHDASMAHETAPIRIGR